MIKIDFEEQTYFIKQLLKLDNISLLKRVNYIKSFISKFFYNYKLKKRDDYIYFYSDYLDKKIISKIIASKYTIVTSNWSKKNIINNINILESKVKVIYPIIKKPILNINNSKKTIYNKYNIKPNDKLLFFTSTHLTKNDMQDIFKIVSQIQNINYKLLILVNKNQLIAFKFQLRKYKFDKRVIFSDNFDDIDCILEACDIFIYLTSLNRFQTIVLKAMLMKCVVFISQNSSCSEILDTFSIMQKPYDKNTPFKIDALLQNEEELINIKNSNHKKALCINSDVNIQDFHSMFS
jgi:glycosyltransferase involved in cell wall biosynthesis